jgi:Response regulator receiver domain./Bacterial regulatory proteins, luxR family.
MSMKVVVVDDDRLVGTSLKTILQAGGEVNVVDVGCSGQEAIELYRLHRPDVILMDIRMSGMSGLDAAEKILSFDPAARILFLTTFSDDAYIIRALKMGARGYILKQDYESILPALKAVYNGQSVFGDEIVSRIPDMFLKNRKPDFSKYGISEKEAEIIALVAEGMNNKEIASALYLSEGTVRNYISVILEKLNLRDRTQLAVFYYKNQ